MRYKDQITTKLESITMFAERLEKNILNNLHLTNSQKLEAINIIKKKVEEIQDFLDIEQNG